MILDIQKIVVDSTPSVINGRKEYYQLKEKSYDSPGREAVVAYLPEHIPLMILNVISPEIHVVSRAVRIPDFINDIHVPISINVNKNGIMPTGIILVDHDWFKDGNGSFYSNPNNTPLF